MADPRRPGHQYQHIRIDQGGKAQLGDTYILRELLQTLSEKGCLLTYARLLDQRLQPLPYLHLISSV